MTILGYGPYGPGPQYTGFSYEGYGANQDYFIKSFLDYTNWWWKSYQQMTYNSWDIFFVK